MKKIFSFFACIAAMFATSSENHEPFGEHNHHAFVAPLGYAPQPKRSYAQPVYPNLTPCAYQQPSNGNTVTPQYAQPAYPNVTTNTAPQPVNPKPSSNTTDGNMLPAVMAGAVFPAVVAGAILSGGTHTKATDINIGGIQGSTFESNTATSSTKVDSCDCFGLCGFKTTSSADCCAWCDGSGKSCFTCDYECTSCCDPKSCSKCTNCSASCSESLSCLSCSGGCSSSCSDAISIAGSLFCCILRIFAG